MVTATFYAVFTTRRPERDHVWWVDSTVCYPAALAEDADRGDREAIRTIIGFAREAALLDAEGVISQSEGALGEALEVVEGAG